MFIILHSLGDLAFDFRKQLQACIRTHLLACTLKRFLCFRCFSFKELSFYFIQIKRSRSQTFLLTWFFLFCFVSCQIADVMAFCVNAEKVQWSKTKEQSTRIFEIYTDYLGLGKGLVLKINTKVFLEKVCGKTQFSKVILITPFIGMNFNEEVIPMIFRDFE